jgi:predicted nuclease of predicted toxin-antitoxin system
VRFLVDAQLPPALAKWLREKGHQADTVRDVGLRDADDNAIWTYAGNGGAVLVTKDEDFALLASGIDRPRLLWVRTGNVVNRLLLARFEQAWPQIEAHFESGARLVELR